MTDVPSFFLVLIMKHFIRNMKLDQILASEVI